MPYIRMHFEMLSAFAMPGNLNYLLPAHCVCGTTMSIEHALSCPFGGFPSICHNELRDITAALLSGVCHNVGIEPHLQPFSGESLQYRSSNVEDGARLDVVQRVFGIGIGGWLILMLRFLTLLPSLMTSLL